MATGKKRGDYSRSPKIEVSDTDIANDIAKCLRKDIALSVWDKSGLAASMNALINAKPAIQRRVLAALKPPHASRRRKRKFPDKEILDGVDYWKDVLAKSTKGKVTDIAAVTYCLEKGFLRLGRLAGTPFDSGSTAGKKEIKRAIDAIVRARRARKSKIPPG